MWQGRLFYLIGCWILLLSSAQALPMFVAVTAGEQTSASGFLGSMLICFVIGGSLFLGFRSSRQVKVIRLTILLPLVGGMSLALVAGLPFFFIFPDQGLVAALFEGMSLITTTGASAYEGSVEGMIAVGFWRAFASWIGGFLAICLALSLLTALNSGGIQLHRSPLPYGDSETGYPRLKAVAVAIAPIYMLVTSICCGFLLLAGEPFGAALQLSMTTISTAGITPSGDHTVDGFWVQLVLVVFMIIAMMNWDVMRAKALRVKIKHPHGSEFRSLLVMLGFACILLFVLSFPGDFEGLWHAVFTTVSAMSTTGFTPSDMGLIGGGEATEEIIVAVLACLGGAVASTTGGLKQLRLIILDLLVRGEVDRLAHPHGVRTVSFQSFTVENRDIAAIWLMIGAFVLTLVFGCVLLAIQGIDFQTSLAMAVSALTLSGPLITMIDPYFPGFSGLTEVDYSIMTGLMLVGRVEATVFLALAARSFWRG